MERACERVKGGRAKSCLACGKAKQRCVGAVWEGGEGLNGTLMGELTGLVRELVGEKKVERASRNGFLRWIWRSEVSEKPQVPSPLQIFLLFSFT